MRKKIAPSSFHETILNDLELLNFVLRNYSKLKSSNRLKNHFLKVM